LYSVCSNTEANTVFIGLRSADGFGGSGQELNHWTSTHCSEFSTAAKRT